MSDVYSQITPGHFLVLSAVLFSIGALGVLLRRNALIMMMMSIELMLSAASISIITFARIHGDMRGQTLALIVIAVAAAEAAVGLAIVVGIFRSRGHIEIDRLTALKN
jgi:NADH-quinone oxidoreductase subunit K